MNTLSVFTTISMLDTQLERLGNIRQDLARLRPILDPSSGACIIKNYGFVNGKNYGFMNGSVYESVILYDTGPLRVRNKHTQSSRPLSVFVSSVSYKVRK